jgi:hypothetical protein
VTVYVDAAIHPWRGQFWCHVFSDDIAELHAFAARIGLRREWFQQPPVASWPHYDTTALRRAAALKMGAVDADRYTLAEVAWRLQGRLTPEKQASLARLRAQAAGRDAPAQGSLF